MAVLSIILVLLSEVTRQTQQVAGQVQQKVEAFRETRAGLEAMARRAGQATLNSYWGYNHPDRPTRWQRQSELHFATVYSDDTLSSGANRASGHGFFFQAPFGYAGSEASTDGDSRLDYLEGLLNAWGYYVEFNSDLPARTPFLQREDAIYPERKRFRLMELRIPSEDLSVMRPPSSDPDGLPAIALESSESGVNQWFADATVRAEYARPIAENVLGMVVSPRLSDGTLPEGNSRIAPDYIYNSRRYQFDGSSATALLSRHQLPELLDITLIATDEVSWIRFEETYGETAPEVFLEEMGQRFQLVSNYEEDLEELKEWMIEQGLEPRVFRVAVPLRSSKFTTEIDA